MEAFSYLTRILFTIFFYLPCPRRSILNDGIIWSRCRCMYVKPVPLLCECNADRYWLQAICLSDKNSAMKTRNFLPAPDIGRFECKNLLLQLENMKRNKNAPAVLGMVVEHMIVFRFLLWDSFLFMTPVTVFYFIVSNKLCNSGETTNNRLPIIACIYTLFFLLLLFSLFVSFYRLFIYTFEWVDKKQKRQHDF